MVLNELYRLSNGVHIPKLGLGTWFIDDDKAAQAYANERGVGEGIRTCGIAREELFVTTKLAAEIKSFEEAVKAINTSLRTMGLDYIDMMIIHLFPTLGKDGKTKFMTKTPLIFQRRLAFEGILILR